MLRQSKTSAVIALIFALAACSGGSQNAPVTSLPAATSSTAVKAPSSPRHGGLHSNEVIGGGPGKLQVLLGDTALPNGANLSAVNLAIEAILVSDASGNVTTVAEYSSPQVVNVLNYQNGNATSIGQGSVPETTYASLTIVVAAGQSNIVTASGTTESLTFKRNGASMSSAGFGTSTVTTGASASTSATAAGYGSGSVAITFKQPFAVDSDNAELSVDFNAFESLIPAGSVVASQTSLSVAATQLQGTISGNVSNTGGTAVQNAVVVAVDSNGNTDATTFTDSNGNFLLHTISSGTYSLTVYNQYTTAAGASITSSGNTNSAASFGAASGVTVTPGQNTGIGTITD